MEPSDQPPSASTVDLSLLPDESWFYPEEFEATTALQEEQGVFIDDDYLNFLLNKEINDYGVQINHESVNYLTADWFKAGRLEAVGCIFRTGKNFGFRDQTSCLAVTYMDRFLSVFSVQAGRPWQWTLVSLACLSLAAKMEEVIQPHSLQVPGNQQYYFENERIRKLESVVLSKLDWKMNSVSPFPFVHYFLPRLSLESLITVTEVVSAILTAIKVEMTSRWRPSTIAAAATLFALDKTLTQESLEQRIEMLSCSDSLNKDDIFVLYNRMKEQEARDSGIPNTNVSPPPSPPPRLPSGHAAESSTRSVGAVGSKRSLTVGQGDHNIENDDNKRQK